MERKLFLENSYRGALIWSHKKLVDTSRSTVIQLYLESTAVCSTGLTLILNHLWSDNIMSLLNIILASPKRSKTKLWGSFKRP
jgi:hypothetical protein